MYRKTLNANTSAVHAPRPTIAVLIVASASAVHVLTILPPSYPIELT